MNFLKSLIFGENQSDTYTLKFSKNYNAWYVKKDYSILYIGQKDKCELFISNMSTEN